MFYRMRQASFERTPPNSPARNVRGRDWTPPHDAVAHDVSAVQDLSLNKRRLCARPETAMNLKKRGQEGRVFSDGGRIEPRVQNH